jgi:cell division protein FtsB
MKYNKSSLLLFAITTLFLFSVLSSSFTGEQKIFSYLNLKKSFNQLTDIVLELEDKIEKVEHEIEKIEKSKEYVKKVLKDKYHITDTNERIILFSE